ncbi:MAG: indole-3-glycerol phosphate synthase TrpC [Planctomycetota bacterium]
MTVLDEILVAVRTRLADDQAKVTADELSKRVRDTPPPLDFVGALFRKTSRVPSVQLIAEVKRASPSAGLIREDFDPPKIAETYESAGAACISVLTEVDHFQGSLDYLSAVRSAVSIPILRKDFIVDEYQILQARAAGADAILLIAECLDAKRMKELHEFALGLGMSTLIELFEPENLDAVLDTNTPLVGINNRNLRNFQTDLQHCIDLAKRVPNDRLVVGESGIRTHDDVVQLGNHGIGAILVGESLMRQSDIKSATRQLLGLGSG